MSTKPLVLVTGATGHIGFRTLVEVLKAGYRARVSTRSLSTAEKIKKAKSVQPYLSNIDYVEVSDMTACGAFDDAVRDVDHILHLASPIPMANGMANNLTTQEVYLNPAIHGTTSILASAAKSPSVKRVVITSSVVILNHEIAGAPVNPNTINPLPDPATVPMDPWIAYRAFKVLAYAAAEEFRKTENPHFSIVYILPSYVQGRNELVTTASSVHNGSNDIMVDITLGKIARGSRPPRRGGVVLVDDVAKIEVAALDLSKGESGERFIASNPTGITWNDIPSMARRLFPEAVEKGILPREGGEGYLESIPITYDVSRTTETFGIRFHELEVMVRSLFGQYVELSR